MATYQLALIVRNPNAEDFEFLVTKQRRPSEKKLEGLPYVDKELYDLPSAPLPRIDGRFLNMSPISEDYEGSLDVAKIVTSSIQKLGLKGFDVIDAISKIQAQVAPAGVALTPWRYWKLVQETDWGLQPPIHTVIFMTDFYIDKSEVPGGGEWVNSQTTMDILVQWGAHSTRIGRLAALAASTHVPDGPGANFESISGQEYPPGIVVLPLKSKTLMAGNKTNLVIFSPSVLSTQRAGDVSRYSATGDVLICDPGCIGAAREQLAHIVKSLPRKLLVFLTHHHPDHTDGLPAVRKNNPDAVLLAHEATFRRMGKATKGFKCITIDGGSKLLIAGHELEIISAPGHTDGHLAIYDASTGTLVVGDHCLGKGSSLLDRNSGGNMQDYMQTTRRLLDLGPHTLVPMHGRPNLWPAHMLTGYIKHREQRELKILKAIQNGARTAYQIVSTAYADTPVTLWFAALENVTLHVEHLDANDNLPENFSMEKFHRSSKSSFIIRCLPAASIYAIQRPLLRLTANPTTSVISGISVAMLVGVIAFYWVKRKDGSMSSLLV
ncbi:hypothetical protein R1sor_009878 [Riccia sorocarpa]|uniref:Metallo-beta-lactamase domain-containing protein n=1 Tax=Riccia sorocarpa TaxID=122646 RepID=A0ABD3HZZ6_9MARC